MWQTVEQQIPSHLELVVEEGLVAPVDLLAAGDEEHLAGDEARRRRGEEDDGVGDLLARPEAGSYDSFDSST